VEISLNEPYSYTLSVIFLRKNNNWLSKIIWKVGGRYTVSEQLYNNTIPLCWVYVSHVYFTLTRASA
jgi:hypothetical protein